jgi:hypothetical protein
MEATKRVSQWLPVFAPRGVEGKFAAGGDAKDLIEKWCSWVPASIKRSRKRF